MRQIELQGPKQIKVTEAPDPKPSVGDVLVEVKATALCGTDVHIYAGDTPVAYPRVPGHEATGIVKEIGPGVDSLSPGDHVVFNPNLNCGSCERCILGKENLCQGIQLLGREVDGTMSQFLTMPQTHSFRIPDNMQFGYGALIQPLSTAVHAQSLVDIRPSESAVVLGLGGTGLMHLRLSKLAGAYPVIAVGRSQWKLDLAEQFGADIIISARDKDPIEEVRQAAGGDGANVVVEAVGTPATMHQALAMTKPGGRMMGFGISPQPMDGLQLLQMYLNQLTMIFPRATTRANFYRTVNLVTSKQIDLEPLLTREYDMSDAAEAFRATDEEQSQVLRVVVRH